MPKTDFNQMKAEQTQFMRKNKITKATLTKRSGFFLDILIILYGIDSVVSNNLFRIDVIT